MPMDFPDIESLELAADLHRFRKIKPEETEDKYRIALANHVANTNFIESEEIRNKVGWDKFTDEQNITMLQRSSLQILKKEKP